MGEFITTMNKNELLERIELDRAAFAALWAGLSDEQMTARPGPQPDWSVKDLIAHITWWEVYMVKRVAAVLEGRADQRVTDEDVDHYNAQTFEFNRDRPLGEILAEFYASFPPIIELIKAMSNDQINRAEAHRGAEIPPLYVIIGNTFGHYEDHIDDLRRYVESLK